MASRSINVSIAVDPVVLVTTECITITSAMRKHARWAHSSVSAILGGGMRPISPGPRQMTTQDKPGHLKSQDLSYLDQSRDNNENGLAIRMGLRGKKGRSIQDNPLMVEFGRLRRELAGCQDIHKFDVLSLLNPFLQVIQASATSASITSLALVAISKFFSYNLISPKSPRLVQAMQSLSTAVTHCRFEASDSAADETVLLRILDLMQEMLSGPGGNLLSDESVCEMMETGLSMCCQSRLSELLRRSAEISMIKMTQIIFERLKHLDVEASQIVEALEGNNKGNSDTVKMSPSANGNDAIKSSLATTSIERHSSSFEDNQSLPIVTNPIESSPNVELESTLELIDQSPVKPYSMPSIRELFRVLVDLLDPHDRVHPDALRVITLRIIDVALQVAGPSIAIHPSLAAIAEDRLCRYLFQLIRSDNMAILHESLIVTGTLLATCRNILKLQQEFLLSYLITCLHPRIEIHLEPGMDPLLYAGVPRAPKIVRQHSLRESNGVQPSMQVRERQKVAMEVGSRKPDAREAMVESLAALARIPSYMTELFVNYDCEVDRADLCEDIVGLLSRNSIPDAATWSTTSVPPLCLDALLGYIQFIFERLSDEPKSEGYPDREKLRAQRRKKKIVIEGAEKFNEKPKAGLEFLESQGIIDDLNDPKSVVKFLSTTARISKKVLGDFISKKGNEAILEAFMNTYNFDGKRVDEALRQLLEGFRLPGESALIERIMTSFSKHYCGDSPPDGVANSDAVFVLTYAILMLNTDSYNPNLKATARMTFEQFSNNLRGVNAGKDFDPKYLRDMFDSIKSNEIILPDEHDNKLSFDYTWKEMLLKTESAGHLIACNTNIYDADIFEVLWKPLVATLSYVFISASEDPVLSRVITGFDQCSQIAATFGLTEAVDQIVYCLSSMTTLATKNSLNTTLNTEVRIDNSSVMVSELSVRFGRDFKAQLATVVLFRVINGSEPFISSSWKHILQIWINFFINSLIPPFPAPVFIDISPIPRQITPQIVERGQKSNDIGFFSAFTSYISSYAADDPPEPSDEEIESTLCTIDCVHACYMENVFSNILNLPNETTKTLVKALLDILPDDPSAIIINYKTEAEFSTDSEKLSNRSPVYDPGIVYILEFSVKIVLTNNTTINAVGADVSRALYNVLRNESHYHWMIVARVTFYLLTLLHTSYGYDFIRVPMVLHTISGFKKELFSKSVSLILKGLNLCIDQPSPLRNEIMISPDFWVILRNSLEDESSALIVFNFLESVVLGSPPSIIAENYESAVQLLHEFATAGSIGATVEQKKENKTKKGQKLFKVEIQEKPMIDKIIARGVKATTMIYSLTSRVPILIKQSHLESKEAWAAYWSPIFRALTTQCTNPCREIRHQAFSSLQNTLLCPQLTFDSQEGWTAIFGEVLLPLIIRLLKPEVYSSDPVGMSETRVQAATLLCRIFLHYLALLSQHDGMLDLWLRILEVMDRLMNSGQGDNLEEAVPESLKNVLLVMSNCNYLVPPFKGIDEQREKLWTETWKRIDRFLPNLRQQLDFESKPG
ncbi:putative sec7 domain-containing protein [Erysiphe necator]|uniref:Putative sec7 domain-containing protein n=1 Tax=Uncinula necator TaxID=52586 RepID=A0A0B1PAW8_UNCNE|nr:putative sec7 domain-containing protein [Erysiphe necator]